MSLTLYCLLNFTMLVINILHIFLFIFNLLSNHCRFLNLKVTKIIKDYSNKKMKYSNCVFWDEKRLKWLKFGKAESKNFIECTGHHLTNFASLFVSSFHILFKQSG